MGMYADAAIFYGIRLCDKYGEPLLEGDMDIEQLFLEYGGWTEPAPEYNTADPTEYRAWLERRSAFVKEHCHLDFTQVGSYDFGYPLVGHDSVIGAGGESYGAAVVDLPALAAQDVSRANTELNKFLVWLLTEKGIAVRPEEREPRWHLVAFYG